MKGILGIGVGARCPVGVGSRRKVGVPGMGTTMLTVATSTRASSRKSAVRRKIPVSS